MCPLSSHELKTIRAAVVLILRTPVESMFACREKADGRKRARFVLNKFGYVCGAVVAAHRESGEARANFPP